MGSASNDLLFLRCFTFISSLIIVSTSCLLTSFCFIFWPWKDHLLASFTICQGARFSITLHWGEVHSFSISLILLVLWRFFLQHQLENYPFFWLVHFNYSVTLGAKSKGDPSNAGLPSRQDWTCLFIWWWTLEEDEGF